MPPIGVVPHAFEWVSIDGAVAPTTGARFFRERPYRNAERCQLFVDALAQALPDRLTIPAHVRLVFLPPYAPELNPIERVWRDLKDDIAWQQLPHVDTQ
jgi:hypothetical protein